MKHTLYARDITSYIPNTELNNQIKRANNLTSDKDYKTFLQINGLKVVGIEQQNKCPICQK